MNYDVKSSKFYIDRGYYFHTGNKYKEEIELYYFLAFNKDWTKFDYGWRVPGEIVEKGYFQVGLNPGCEFDIEDMDKYDIKEQLKLFTDKFKDIMK